MEHLINPEWFAGQPQWALLLVTAAAMYVVIKSADWLVEGASGTAMRMGMSKIIVGATIVSLGTTSPECAVSVIAAWKNDPGLALGNAVGSVIADTGLIFGLGCLIATLPVDRFILNRQGWVQFGSAVLLAGLSFGLWFVQGEGAMIPRWAGAGLLVLLGVYMYLSVRWGKQHASRVVVLHEEEEEIEEARHRPWWRLIVGMVVGIVGVVVFSTVLIESVKELAVQWGVPHIVISSTIVALGTSLPELVIGLTAVKRGHPELLIGNVIGADILNVLFVTGAAAVAAPLPIVDKAAAYPDLFLMLHLPVMLGVLGLFRIYIFSAIGRGHFRRWFGVPLLGMYVGYIVLNVVFSR